MDRQQISLKLTMNALKLPFKIDSFQDRLILQKAVYLVQAGGVNLGYYYHWYLYGPYCPVLARDAYSVAGELSLGIDETKNWKLDDVSQSRLQDLRKLMTKDGRETMSRELELLASIHFLVKGGRVSSGDTGMIADTLKRFGKTFTEEEVRGALQELKKYDLLRG